jgi:hypothetical protein
VYVLQTIQGNALPVRIGSGTAMLEVVADTIILQRPDDVTLRRATVVQGENGRVPSIRTTAGHYTRVGDGISITFTRNAPWNGRLWRAGGQVWLRYVEPATNLTWAYTR